MPVKAKQRPVRVIEDSNCYLVRMDSRLFYLRTAGDGKPLCIGAPSAAAHLSYKEADQICTHFRSMGYEGPVVCDIYGQIVDNAALESERAEQAERSRKFWGS